MTYEEYAMKREVVGMEKNPKHAPIIIPVHTYYDFLIRTPWSKQNVTKEHSKPK